MEMTAFTREFCSANEHRHGASSFFLQKAAVLLTRPRIHTLCMVGGLLTFSAHDWSRMMLWLVTQHCHFTGLFFYCSSVSELTSWPERHYCPDRASSRTKRVLSWLMWEAIRPVLGRDENPLHSVISPWQTLYYKSAVNKGSWLHILLHKACRYSARVQESAGNFSSPCGTLQRAASSSDIYASRQSSRSSCDISFCIC